MAQSFAAFRPLIEHSLSEHAPLIDAAGAQALVRHDAVARLGQREGEPAKIRDLRPGVAFRLPGRPRAVAQAIHAHPTMMEVLGEAAEDADALAIHLLRTEAKVGAK